MKADEDSGAAGAGPDSRMVTELYEKLRGWVLDRSTEPQVGLGCLGLGVLVRGGMSHWMATCLSLSDTMERPSAGATSVTRPTSVTPPLAATTQAQLATIVASILLSRCEGEAR